LLRAFFFDYCRIAGFYRGRGHSIFYQVKGGLFGGWLNKNPE
jgi:hypothetical protein